MKLEIIKETNRLNEVRYFIEENGTYVPSTCSSNISFTEACLEKLKENNSIKREILKTIEYED